MKEEEMGRKRRKEETKNVKSKRWQRGANELTRNIKGRTKARTGEQRNGRKRREKGNAAMVSFSSEIGSFLYCLSS